MKTGFSQRENNFFSYKHFANFHVKKDFFSISKIMTQSHLKMMYFLPFSFDRTAKRRQKENTHHITTAIISVKFRPHRITIQITPRLVAPRHIARINGSLVRFGLTPIIGVIITCLSSRTVACCAINVDKWSDFLCFGAGI